MSATTKGRGYGVSREVDPPPQSLDVTPDDDTDLPWISRALYVGVGGDVRLWLVSDETTAASGTVTFASSSGAVGATINGTLVTVTWATSDAASATAFCAAVLADVTVGPLLDSTKTTNLDSLGNATATTTLVYKNPAPAGDGITLVASGTNVSVSGATFSGAAGTRLYKNMLSGTDYPRAIRRVMDEDTTAESMIILR